MRRNDDAAIIPQARLRRALEFPIVNVERDAAQASVGQSLQQGFFVDNLTARDVDQNRSWFHSRKSRAADQMVCLLGPRATNGDELAIAQQIMQKIRGFESCEAGRKR